MNKIYIKTLESHLDHWKRLYAEHICEEKEGRETIEALQAAIQALQMGADAIKKMSYLTDRPCEVCKFNEDGNGCKKWNCVFEEVDDGQAESN